MAIFVPHGALAKRLGQDVLHLEVRTVGELLREVERRVGPADWAWARRATVLVNGRNMHHLAGPATPLGSDDQVWMVLPSGGG